MGRRNTTRLINQIKKRRPNGLLFLFLIYVNFLALEHLVDLLELTADEKVAALVTDVAAGYVGGIVTVPLSLLGGEVAALAVRELNYEGLLGVASRLDAISVIEEELKGICRKGYVTESYYVRLDRVYLGMLLISEARDSARVNVALRVILKGEYSLIGVLFNVVFDLADGVIILGLGRLS